MDSYVAIGISFLIIMLMLAYSFLIFKVKFFKSFQNINSELSENPEYKKILINTINKIDLSVSTFYGISETDENAKSRLFERYKKGIAEKLSTIGYESIDSSIIEIFTKRKQISLAKALEAF